MRARAEEGVRPASRRVAVVPGAPALEPRYASLVDPVAPLRARVDAARAWADHVVVLNGSARRTESSPGPRDPRAQSFDDALFAALVACDLDALRAVDVDLARELWAAVDQLPVLVDLLADGHWAVTVKYDEAPYGVAWWVILYENADR